MPDRVLDIVSVKCKVSGNIKGLYGGKMVGEILDIKSEGYYNTVSGAGKFSYVCKFQ
jgi:hypothetical protein